MREIKFRAWDGKKMDMVRTLWLQFVEKDWYIPGDKKYEAIMQYTGLKDKNGKEIYEGDIVKRFEEDDEYERVIWNDFNCRAWNERDLEIIGNIYENPELLSGN